MSKIDCLIDRLPEAWLILALAVLVGCSAPRRPAIGGVSGLAWPPVDPRVRLEKVIRLEELSRGRGSGALRRLAGERVGIPIGRPFGVAWDGDDLLVTDAGEGRVLRVTSTGRLVASPGNRLQTPVAVAVCSGRVLVTDSRGGRLVRLKPDLRIDETLLADLDRPTGIVCNDSQVWVVETARHRLLNLQPDGEVRWVGHRGTGEREFNYPTALAVGRGALWVADTLNFRIQRLSLNAEASLGAFGRVGAAPGEMPRLKGLAVDGSGHVWVSDAHLDQVALYAPDGEYLMSIGGFGAAPGRFSFPAGIAAHTDGRVAVVDSLNRRLQIFRLLRGADGQGPNGGEL